LPERLLDHRQHVDIPLGFLGFGTTLDPHHPGDHDRDGLSLLVHSAPLEHRLLAQPHPGYGEFGVTLWTSKRLRWG
jgi:hypothetical protein